MAGAGPCPCSCSSRSPPLGEGDVAAAHPRENFGRRLDWHDGKALRPVAELFTVLVCDPTGLVAALGGDVCQHGVPFSPLERAVAHARLAALDEPEFAVGGHNEL